MNASSRMLSFFLLCAMQTTCANDHEKFVQAESMSMREDYAQALPVYQSVESKGFEVLYNIALCYAHQHNLPQAMVYAQRAEKYGNFKQLGQLYRLYTYVFQQINPEFSYTHYEQLVIFCKKCILSIPMILLQLLLLLLLSIIIFFSVWCNSIKKTVVLPIIILTILVGFFWEYKAAVMRQKTGIVTSNVTPVFAGPDRSFYKKSELQALQNVDIIIKQQGFYHIKTEKIMGWISDNDVELI